MFSLLRGSVVVLNFFLRGTRTAQGLSSIGKLVKKSKNSNQYQFLTREREALFSLMAAGGDDVVLELVYLIQRKHVARVEYHMRKLQAEL